MKFVLILLEAVRIILNIFLLEDMGAEWEEIGEEVM